ncbi:MAG: acetylglutamate kinase [Bacillus thermozeamaize]|jgi:acetylglutamate kinase|uniref:Acetylglutamate kinase n=1 Tax=Bacillus thermozeamaize TaxID=230954 RepID=A0A1Y3PN14_9BACI|nr:MAG: acetylglutamate kinase [Bacillus thermozeamaize]
MAGTSERGAQGGYLVIKCGGSTLEQLPASFYEELVRLPELGYQPVVVHGGGPVINQLLKRLNVESRFEDGLRVTDAATLEVVEMALAGLTNKALVSRILQSGGKAVGISGVDGGLIAAEIADERLGFVGQVSKVRVELLHLLVGQGYIPVIASLGVSATGQHLNINADTAAGAVAAALGAAKLLLLTDVEGVYVEEDGQRRWLRQLSPAEVERLIAEGQIRGGMIPKVRAALEVLAQGVHEVAILPGASEQAMTRFLRGEEVGTAFCAAAGVS